MSARAQLLEHSDYSSLFFECPGCGFAHAPAVRGTERAHRPIWEWNGSLDLPTISPSLLVRWSENGRDLVCHSFIRDGRIQFLGDCTHALAGQTVDLPAVAP